MSFWNFLRLLCFAAEIYFVKKKRKKEIKAKENEMRIDCVTQSHGKMAEAAPFFFFFFLFFSFIFFGLHFCIAVLGHFTTEREEIKNNRGHFGLGIDDRNDFGANPFRETR